MNIRHEMKPPELTNKEVQVIIDYHINMATKLKHEIFIYGVSMSYIDKPCKSSQNGFNSEPASRLAVNNQYPHARCSISCGTNILLICTF